jgi:hypothetical protein
VTLATAPDVVALRETMKRFAEQVRESPLPFDVALSLSTELSVAASAILASALQRNGKEDRLLRLDEAAAMLNIAPGTLREKARKNAAFRDLCVRTGTRVLRFSERRVQSFIARR